MADARAKSLKDRITKRELKRLQKDACSTLQCEWCPDKKFSSLTTYNDHMASKKHKRHKKRSAVGRTWTCMACELTVPNYAEWTKHLCGSRHSKKLHELSLQLLPTAAPLTEQEIQLLDDSSYQEEEEDEEKEEESGGGGDGDDM